MLAKIDDAVLMVCLRALVGISRVHIQQIQQETFAGKASNMASDVADF